MASGSCALSRHPHWVEIRRTLQTVSTAAAHLAVVLIRRSPVRERYHSPMAKPYREHDLQSTSSAAAEDLRRRCLAYGRWMAIHPTVVEFSEKWADRSVEALPCL